MENLYLQPAINEYSNKPTIDITTNSQQGIFVRKGTGIDSDFNSKGKYTKNFQTPSTSLGESSMFSLDYLKTDLICKLHSEYKDSFLFEKIDNFNLYDRICKYCESEIKMKIRRTVNSQLYSEVIQENKDKILQIREKNISLDSFSTKRDDDCKNMLNDRIFPIADEIIDLADNFQKEILSKLTDNEFFEQSNSLKEFITSMQFNSRGDPYLSNIGENASLKAKYIQLALFLVHFSGGKSNSGTKKGISESLKTHLLNIIRLRKVIVRNFTEWLRFLIGDFYDFVFSAENLNSDNEFRNSLQIEFSSEEEIYKLKYYYENIIKQKDDKISLLILENEMLKNSNEEIRKISEERDNLRMRVGSMQVDYDIQIKNLMLKFENLTKENVSLRNNMNSYMLQIENYKEQINNLNYQLDEFKFKISTLNEKDSEISKLKLSLVQFREEWDGLCNSYDEILIGIKQQFEINQRLSNLIFHLEDNIDKNNKICEYSDFSLREQFEFITKEGLKNEKIEMQINFEVLKKNQIDINNLKLKLENLENQKFYKSTLFSNLIIKPENSPGMRNSVMSNYVIQGNEINQGLPNHNINNLYYNSIPGGSVGYENIYNLNLQGINVLNTARKSINYQGFQNV